MTETPGAAPSRAERARPGRRGGMSDGADFPAGTTPHFHGHRDRLRARFMAGGPDPLPDYELLELVLFRAVPRKDVKPLAKDMIARFGSFAGVIGAAPERLREVKGIGETVIQELKIIQAAAIRLTRQQAMGRPVLSSWRALIDYCSAAMAQETTEQFRILFLDRKNALIADEVQQRGTVDHTPVYPREVVRRALELASSAIILVHNHPSGDATPSRADVEVTKEIVEAGKILGIQVHDHLIIAKGGHASLKALGLL